MSLVLEALRGGRSSRIPQPVHAARTDAVLQTLGHRRAADRHPFVHVLVVLGGLLLAAGLLAVFLFVASTT